MSLWGEISAPESRAAWHEEEEEEEEEAAPAPGLSWQKNAPLQENVKTLIIVEGKRIQCNTGELIDTIPQVNLQLCKGHDAETVVCFITTYDIMLSGEIIELLQHYLISSENVIAVLSLPLCNYKTQSLLDTSCVVRSLCTTNIKPEPSIQRLEQPNIISGVTAGAISLREHVGKSALVYICYTEFPDSCDAEELRALLKKLNIQPSSKHTSAVTTSNLYI